MTLNFIEKNTLRLFLLFLLSFVLAPIFLMVGIFIPVLGQVILLLDLGATIAFWWIKGSKVALAMFSGLLAWVLFFILFSAQLSDYFTMLTSLVLIVAIPVSVLYFLVVSYLVAKELIGENSVNPSNLNR